MPGISKIIIGIALALLLGVGSWGGWQYIQLQKAVTAKTEAESAKKAAEDALAVVVEVNKTNKETIESMKTEKDDIEKSISNLEAARARDAKVIGTLSEVIKNQSLNPANRVQLSPVLQEVITKIQAERAVRGVKK